MHWGSFSKREDQSALDAGRSARSSCVDDIFKSARVNDTHRSATNHAAAMESMPRIDPVVPSPMRVAREPSAVNERVPTLEQHLQA